MENDDFSNKHDFIDCKAWRGLAAKISKSAHLGDLILVAGRLRMRETKDENFQKHYSAEIVADTIHLVDEYYPYRESAQMLEDYDNDEPLPWI